MWPSRGHRTICSKLRLLADGQGALEEWLGLGIAAGVPEGEAVEADGEAGVLGTDGLSSATA